MKTFNALLIMIAASLASSAAFAAPPAPTAGSTGETKTECPSSTDAKGLKPDDTKGGEKPKTPDAGKGGLPGSG